MSQIFNLGPSVCFMSKNGKLFAIFCTLYFKQNEIYLCLTVQTYGQSMLWFCCTGNGRSVLNNIFNIPVDSASGRGQRF